MSHWPWLRFLNSAYRRMSVKDHAVDAARSSSREGPGGGLRTSQRTFDKDLGERDEADDVRVDHRVDLVLVNVANLFATVDEAGLRWNKESVRIFAAQRIRAKTCVVHQDVDLAQLLGDPVQQALDLLAVLHVEREGDDLSALARRALLVRLFCRSLDLVELGLAAGCEDQGSTGTGKEDGLCEVQPMSQ